MTRWFSVMHLYLNAVQYLKYNTPLVKTIVLNRYLDDDEFFGGLKGWNFSPSSCFCHSTLCYYGFWAAQRGRFSLPCPGMYTNTTQALLGMSLVSRDHKLFVERQHQCICEKVTKIDQKDLKNVAVFTKIRFTVTCSHGMYRIPHDQIFNREF